MPVIALSQPATLLTSLRRIVPALVNTRTLVAMAAPDAHRYGIDAAPVGPVSAEHRDIAKQRLKMTHEKR